MALEHRVINNHSFNPAVVIWVHGNPGSGKTSICQSICAFLEYQHNLYCSRAQWVDRFL